ncbi:hypothetical protein [Pseudophaeobacter sp. C1-32P7]
MADIIVLADQIKEAAERELTPAQRSKIAEMAMEMLCLLGEPRN